jgi:hypothetical protein
MNNCRQVPLSIFKKSRHLGFESISSLVDVSDHTRKIMSIIERKYIVNIVDYLSSIFCSVPSVLGNTITHCVALVYSIYKSSYTLINK